MACSVFLGVLHQLKMTSVLSFTVSINLTNPSDDFFIVEENPIVNY